MAANPNHARPALQQQPATPELLRWIEQQQAAGIGRDAMHAAMLQSGWNAAAAHRILDQTVGRAQFGLVEPEPPPLPVSAVPTIALDDKPARLWAGDRWVDVLAVMDRPRIVVFGNLLSQDECRTLMEAARPRLERSTTVDVKTGGSEVNAVRTSDGMFFNRGENAICATIEARIAKLIGWPVENGEGLQILRYRPGAEYKPHYDYFDPSEPGTPTLCKRGGQRVATVIMYLHTADKGGGTVFPDVPLEVAPIAGNGVFFSYERPHPDTKTLHGGAPVIEGEKWIATKWLREGVFI
jgi:prolyl 4-hydroxylase